MSDYDHLADDVEYAGWLKAIAVRADELATTPAARDRFRQMLRTWKDDLDAEAPQASHNKRGHFQHNTVEILPVRALTECMEGSGSEVLAAAGTDCVPIGPPLNDTPKDAKPHDVARKGAGWMSLHV